MRIKIREGAEHPAFDADLSRLVDYELPPHSLVFVEAYRQANWMRFGYGQIGAITPARDRLLTNFDSADGIKFRVKVTSHGDVHKLLAEADAIPPDNHEQADVGRTPLLPVKGQSLGDEIYRLDFSSQDGRPLLLINKDAGNWRDMAKSPAFVALAYPSIFREILIRVLLVDRHDDAFNLNEWRSLWVRFACQYPGLQALPGADDSDERADWIQDATAAFSRSLQARARFAEYWKDVE